MKKVKKLTKEERDWLDKFQELMNNCPSNRFGAYTVGDPCITIYDSNIFKEYMNNNSDDQRDDVNIHTELNDELMTITTPFNIDGVCG